MTILAKHKTLAFCCVFSAVVAFLVIGQSVTRSGSAFAMQNAKLDTQQTMTGLISGEWKNGNLLPHLTAVDTQEFESLRALLKTGEVATPTKACKFAEEYFISTTKSEFLSGEMSRVTGLVRLGRDVDGFGKEKDFAWIVRTFYTPVLVEFWEVRHEFWVNARDGKVLSVFPIQ